MVDTSAAAHGGRFSDDGSLEHPVGDGRIRGGPQGGGARPGGERRRGRPVAGAHEMMCGVGDTVLPGRGMARTVTAGESGVFPFRVMAESETIGTVRC